MKQVDRAEVAAAVKRLYQTEDGAIVIGWLSQKFGFVNRSTFCAGDHSFTAFREGQRSVIVGLGNLIEAAPGSFKQPTTVDEDFEDDDLYQPPADV